MEISVQPQLLRTSHELFNLAMKLLMECAIIVVSDKFFTSFLPDDLTPRHIKLIRLMAQEVVLLIFIVFFYAHYYISFIMIAAVIFIFGRIVYLWWKAPGQRECVYTGQGRVISKPLSYDYSVGGHDILFHSPQVYFNSETTKPHSQHMYQCTEDSVPKSSVVGLALRRSTGNTNKPKPYTGEKLLLRFQSTLRDGASCMSQSLHSRPLNKNRGNDVPVVGNLEPRETIPVHETPIFYPPAPSTTPPGLSNRGNNCFINSTVQCLTWIPGFVKCLPRFPSLKSVESVFLRNLHDVFILCHVVPDGKTQHMSVPITPLLSSISKLAPHLVAETGSNQYQQDAAEFLLWLLDCLHTILRNQSKGTSGIFTETNLENMRRNKEACLETINKTGSKDFWVLVEPMTNLSDLDWDLHWQEYSSSLYDLFLGQLLEARECQNCNRITMSIEYFTLLPLPLPDENKRDCTLVDCFINFGKVEELVSDNMVHCSCSKGDVLNPATRLALLSVVPKCLIIQLSRFSYNSTLHAALKNNAPVYFSRQLDLFPHTMKAKLAMELTETMMYELCGFLVHCGAQSTSYGHYIAFCKAKDKKWYCFNDEDVCHVTDDEIDSVIRSDTVSQNAYLLFYHRISQ